MFLSVLSREINLESFLSVYPLERMKFIFMKNIHVNSYQMAVLIFTGKEK